MKLKLKRLLWAVGTLLPVAIFVFVATVSQPTVIAVVESVVTSTQEAKETAVEETAVQIIEATETRVAQIIASATEQKRLNPFTATATKRFRNRLVVAYHLSQDCKNGMVAESAIGNGQWFFTFDECALYLSTPTFLPPTATFTSLPTWTPTDTPVPDTDTPMPDTDTPIPDTETPLPIPTETPTP